MNYIKAKNEFAEIKNYDLMLTNEIIVDDEIIYYKETLFHLHNIITINLYNNNYYLIYDLQNNSNKLYKMK